MFTLTLNALTFRKATLRIITAGKALHIDALASINRTAGALVLSMVMLALIITDGKSAQKRQEVMPPAQLRLLSAGWDNAKGNYRAVVEISLAPGYKTYWRMPGDSGVPTSFDWAKSDNVADAKVRFPVPTRFFDGVGYAVGYLQTVRFPVEVVAAAEGQPMVLRLTASFGVCREICIPEQVEVEATLSEIEDIAGLWEETIMHLPIAVKPGVSADGLQLKDAQLTASQLELHVTGEIGEHGDVFVESPAGWQFGQPQRQMKDDGVRFILPIEHSKPTSSAIALTVTIKGKFHAIEVPLKLMSEGF